MSAVRVKFYNEPPLSRREVWRYSGVTQESPEHAELLGECLAALQGRLSYRACYAECSVSVTGDEVDLGFVRVRSASLAGHLLGCRHAVVFAATVGAEPDRLITRYGAVSPAKALLLDAIATERIEALCGTVCAELEREYAPRGLSLRPRFSPGYGDLALDVQRDIFAMLNCPKHIGVSLGAELLMSPMKSVTAIVGVYDENH